MGFFLLLSIHQKHEHLFNMAFRYCFVGVEYVDNTRVLEQWYPLIFVWYRSILVYNWCLSFCCCIFAKPRYTHGFVFSYEGNKRVFIRWCRSCASLYTWVHSSCLFCVGDWLFQSIPFWMEHMAQYTIIRVLLSKLYSIRSGYLMAANGLSVLLYLIPVKVVTALINV